MKTKKIILAAVFLYMFLAPLSYHPDIKVDYFHGGFLSEGILNIYAHISQNANAGRLGVFSYPPLAYFMFGILYPFVKLVAGRGFSEWVGMGNDMVSIPHIFQYLFAMKLPFIFIHIVTGVVLSKFLDDEKGKIAAFFWLFNPVSIYTIGLMGEFDGIVVLLTTLSVVVISRKPVLAGFLVGLGAALKTYPLLLLPFAVVLGGKSWRDKLKIASAGIITPGVFLLLYAATPQFYESNLLSGLSQRLFELKFYLGFNESILALPALLIILFLYAICRDFNKSINLYKYFFAVTFLVVAGSHFHPQWVLWSMPFLAIIVAHKKNDISVITASLLLFLGFIFTIIFFNDTFLTWGLISPLDPGVLFLPTPSNLIKNFIDPNLVRSLWHTLIFSAGLWILVLTFKDYKHE